jgi:hypothetical protein
MEIEDLGPPIENNIAFDGPDPGFETVIDAVPARTMLEVGTVAVSLPEFTNVVDKAAPFQLTIEPATNPVPLVASVNDGPPNVMAVGTSG